MPRKSSSPSAKKASREGKDSPSDSPASPAPQLGASVSPIVHWHSVSRTLEALGNTATGDSGAVTAPLLKFASRLTSPLFLLAELHQFTGAAHDGHRGASSEIARRVSEIAHSIPQATRAGQAVRESATEAQLLAKNEAHPSSVINEQGFAELVSTLASTRDTRALDTLLGLVVLAEPASRLLTALEREGLDGLVREVRWLRALARPEEASPSEHLGLPKTRALWSYDAAPMIPLAGSLPIPIPGLPGGPVPPIGGGLGGYLSAWLKKNVGKGKPWDPEIEDHRPIVIVDPGEYVDFPRIRCQIWLTKILIDLEEPAPPRPARVVWSDNITRIDAGGACVGDRVTIRGSGFGKSKPPNVGLVISISGVCTPVNANSADWTNTKIEFTFPPDVTSGAVGFVDLNYVGAYNAWVDRQNQRVTLALDAAKCGKVHVTLAPYLTFRECPPLTPFNYVLAGSAIINGFNANWQTLLVVEPPDAITLHWDVTNAQQITIARISGTGPLFSGATQLVTTSATGPWALGPPNHPGPEEFVYRLTAAGPCGTVAADVRIIATKSPALRIDNFEITQGLQTTTGDVRRVAQKSTVVRVFIGHGLGGWGGDAVPDVIGRARIRHGLAGSPWLDPVNGSNPITPTPGTSITVPAAPQRRNTNDTLNFLFPAFQCFDTAVIDVEIRINGFDARAGWAGHSQMVRGTSPVVAYETRRIIDLRYIQVNWSGNTPDAATCDATLRGSLPLLPLPTVTVAPLGGVGVQVPGSTNNAGRNDLLDDFDDRHNCSTWEAMWEWLGADCPDDDGAIWVLIPGIFFEGSAYDIPSNVCFTPPKDGPYAAHELAHCLNQRHLGVMCATTGRTAPGGDAPGAWPNNGQLTDTPFDITTNATVPGDANGLWDLMTYCGTPTNGVNNTWPTPQRWQWLWDYIGS